MNKSQDQRLTGRGVEQPGEHLEHIGLARAVGDQGNRPAHLLNLERNIVRRARFVVSPPNESFDRSPEPAFLAVGSVNFSQPGGFNGRHNRIDLGGARARLLHCRLLFQQRKHLFDEGITR